MPHINPDGHLGSLLPASSSVFNSPKSIRSLNPIRNFPLLWFLMDFGWIHVDSRGGRRRRRWGLNGLWNWELLFCVYFLYN